MADAEAGPPKTAKQLEKEKQRLAKLEKFKQKQDKKASVEPKDKSEVGLPPAYLSGDVTVA